MNNITKFVGGTSLGTIVTGAAIWSMDKLGWIDRWAFEWGDFATLVTGGVAAIGAIWIGRKQTKIAERQVAIMDRQILLDENNLKAELFERRLETYKITVDFLIHLHDLAEEEEGKKRLSTYASKMQESRFIFQPHVYPALKEIWEAGNRLRVARTQSIRAFQDRLPCNEKVGKTIEELQGWSWTKLETIHELFAPDLTIDAKGLHITPSTLR